MSEKIPTIIVESPQSKEIFSTSNQRVALQTRLILGGEALNPKNIYLEKVAPIELSTIKPETIDKINHASTEERADYWKNKGSFDQQLKSWCNSMVEFYNDPHFTKKEALEIYHRYFGGNKSESNINIYVDEVITDNTQNGVINFDQLNQNLSEIKKGANIFGGNSAEIIEDLILARAKLSDPEKKQELIEQANEEKTIDNSPILRINYLNSNEERLLRWLNQDKSPTEEVVIQVNLTNELAKTNPELYKKTLLEKIKNENPKMYSIWELLCKNNRTSADKLIIDSTTWFSESDSKDGITLGTALMDEGSKYTIIFDDSKFNYEDEVVYRFSHEMSHKLIPYLSETKNQNSEFDHLLETLDQLRSKPGNKGISSLAGLGLYKKKGARIQAWEDLTEMVNMYIQDPSYLKNYFDFLSNPNYSEIRKKYNLTQLSPETSKSLIDSIERGLKPLNDELENNLQLKKIPEPKPKREPMRVTPEQNLKAAQFFCNNLREKVKNGTVQKLDNSNFNFTDPESSISIKAESKNGVDTAWTDSNTFTNWASKHNLPLVIWHQVEAGHYTLLLKGPEKQYDGQYKVLIYNPFKDQEEYETVPIHEEFGDFKKRELPKLHYNPTLERYELGDESYVKKDRVDQYLLSQWFKLPPGRNYYASEPAYQQLVSKSDPYNLSISEDADLPQELKIGKGQRFQFNGYDCGPLSFYSSVLRFAALPGHENEKKQLTNSFAEQFDVRILTREELLGK